MLVSLLLSASAQALAPVPNMANDWWSRVYDTPGSGLAVGEISFVIAEMTVSQRGNVSNCVGKVYLGNPQMGPYVCKRLRMRASFEPARDPAGNKVMGVYRKVIINANIRKEGEVSFPSPKLEIAVSAPTGPLSNNPFEIQFYVDGSGAVSSCSLVRSVGINLMRKPQVVESKLVKEACDQVAAKLKPGIVRDKKGVAVPSTQNAIIFSRTRAEPIN